MTLVEENRIWMCNYVRLSNIRRREELLRQKEEIMKEVNEVLAVLRRRKTLYAKECTKYINNVIVPYLEKNKFLPDSYLDMMEQFIKTDKKEV